ncbi:hypothetical protein HGM15179_014390 [Zosterops borbonicus]|uniref:E3 ubiquitin-protein ligase RNF182 n=1 Tax=Zosterops borbonicus TaxID=364589 RepID=A0A8K1G6Y6_9PASS|nr:hypothetical protein HGM15179_014390 [Zosterops borbonicus]
MEPAGGEEAPSAPAGQGRAGLRDENEPGGSGEPPRCCEEASAAAWGCWELPRAGDAREPPQVGDAREPLLPGHGELPQAEDAQEPPQAEDAQEPPLPGHGEPLGPSLPAGQGPPAADTRGQSPSPGSQRLSSSVLSLFSEAEEEARSGAGLALAGGEDECPICTEPYDQQRHRAAVLNCKHGLCRACLRHIMDTAAAAELGRVRCPICRQKTPMLEWEICKLQEELLLLHAQPGSPGALVTSRPPILPPRRPGLAGALEHRFQVRFHTSRMFGCLPCVRYPPCLIRALARLERRCRCCYLLLLALLLAAEMLSLLLIFLPIVLMVMLFLILDK